MTKCVANCRNLCIFCISLKLGIYLEWVAGCCGDPPKPASFGRMSKHQNQAPQWECIELDARCL